MKLTQNQFAELVNLSIDSIGKIERCVTVPKIATLYKIAGSLKIPIETLLPSSKEKPLEGLPEGISALVNYLKTRPAEDTKFIHELAVKILERKK
jgi:transcriptional regulator with XRE-family HTH domain